MAGRTAASTGQRARAGTWVGVAGESKHLFRGEREGLEERKDGDLEIGGHRVEEGKSPDAFAEHLLHHLRGTGTGAGGGDTRGVVTSA